ncbi:hypothetical protein SAMN05216587_11521 [Selenomonas ruminantium]|uniref:Reverse transcriptase (RNA-dependent DNA polymerase) n=2 Tax=Selenomonas ruminantium TaxID=971 RepID=A0A1I0YKS2_SELRU|nr:hypothetical protein SAMN05216587_11521 [Selenomonas ruminantium]
MMIEAKHWEAAYKKLKGSVYYDKTQALLRDRIVLYEKEYSFDSDRLSSRFEKLHKILLDKGNQTWQEYSQGIIDQIDVRCFPKRMYMGSMDTVESNADSDSNENGEKLAGVIINMRTANATISETQSFIDMPVEGQLLGILWVMIVGKVLARNEYRHSYGNKMSKRMMESTDDKPFSPYLFEPYFAQYENWRDHGIEIARNFLDKGENVIILMMDFHRFYYNVHITPNDMDEIMKEYEDSSSDITDEEKNLAKKLNDFIYNVLQKYSEVHGCKNRTFLPIGFYPSGVLANAYMRRFDTTLSEQWSPLYYGRYVDDIIVVDKVGKGSYLEKKAGNNELSTENVLQYFMQGCSVDRSRRKYGEVEDGHMGILLKDSEGYRLNPLWLKSDCDQEEPSDKYVIRLSHKKSKAFFFRPEGSQVLLKEFQRILRKNSSEFRYLPWDDNEETEDYSSIIHIENSKTPNKLSGVDSVELDKYGTSKFLGKLTMYQQFEIPEDSESIKDDEFFRDLLKWFDATNIIENYLFWGRIIQLLALRGDYDGLEDFLGKIYDAIESVKIELDNQAQEDYCNDEFIKSIPFNTKESLHLYLKAVLARELSLHWGAKIKSVLHKLWQSKLKNTKFDEYKKELSSLRIGYCKSRMCDKYRMPVLIDFILQDEQEKELLTSNNCISLARLQDCLKLMQKSKLHPNMEYIFSPYSVTPQEMSICQFWRRICVACDDEDNRQLDLNRETGEDKSSVEDTYLICQYMTYNYKKDEHQDCNSKSLIKQKSLSGLSNDNKKVYAFFVSSDSAKKIRVGVANISKDEREFTEALQGRIHTSANQYQNIATVLNEAKRNKTHLIILPESILPAEWLMPIARWCAKNQIGLVTGVSHIPYEKYIINMTAILLPYMRNDHKYAYMVPHVKVLYSPEEQEHIESVGLIPVHGQSYEIFGWHNVWFPVYCCYELTSIRDRSIFQNIADLFVAVEWNRDVPYFSSIIESLCRDMHCYCAQSNVSQYGDSRIISPSSSVSKDMVRTKGGINASLQIVDLDIERLREFQSMGYAWQRENKDQFKPTPPYFDRGIVRAKQENRLWEYL